MPVLCLFYRRAGLQVRRPPRGQHVFDSRFCRRSSSRSAKTILQGTVQGGRRRGRQRKRWEDSTEEWTGLEWNNIIIIIIIALKGAIRDFLQSPHSAANCLQHARSSGPGAIVCKSRATHPALITCNMSCYVPLGTKGQLS